jgi:cell division protein FtsQ
MWMTPFYRRMVTTVIPLMIFATIGYFYTTSENVKARFQTSLEHAKQTVQDRPEFQLQILRINGASPALADAVRTAANVSFPVSSFKLELSIIKERIEVLDPVKTASLYARAGGILDVVVIERIPVAVWRSDGDLEIVDTDGERVANLDARKSRPDLPLIVGDGAKPFLREALALVKVADPIRDRVRGLIRISNRRWDLVLDNQQVIKLPELEPEAALERVLALHKAQRVLGRDITVIDMRDGKRPVLRMTEEAQGNLREARELVRGEE